MTADKTDKSLAREHLDLALGEARVNLNDLLPAEFDALLQGVFRELDLREMRGFKSLKDLITRRPTSGSRETWEPTEFVKLKPFIELRGSMPESFDPHNTHVARVCRGLLRHSRTYRRFESHEETADREVVETWGHRAYVSKVEDVTLVLRRSGELFEVRYIYEKVLHKDEMLIGFIEAKEIKLEAFREHFGLKYALIACDLIWELRALVHQTEEDLKWKATFFGRLTTKLERLGNAISA